MTTYNVKAKIKVKALPGTRGNLVHLVKETTIKTAEIDNQSGRGCSTVIWPEMGTELDIEFNGMLKVNINLTIARTMNKLRPMAVDSNIRVGEEMRTRLGGGFEESPPVNPLLRMALALVTV